MPSRRDHPGMESEEPTRYCRVMRRRGAVPRAALTVRHGGAGLTLVRARCREVSPPVKSRRGVLAFAAGVAGLIASVALLLNGPLIGAGPPPGPCPAGSSVAAHAGGYLLRVRAEPGGGAAALVHLCAEPAIGAVRTWTVAVAGARRGQPAVLRVAERSALASVPLTAGRYTDITVTLVAGTGRVLAFTARIAGA
jgi:hypothetical protein